MNKEYNRLMKRCINLAKKSEGRVSPNPLVGAVIFDDEYNIIAEGRHEKYGENHAERNAILNCKTDLKGKSLIVNLEPCSHYGKTPPCADLIIEKGIKKVVIGMVDPNPIVRGKGIEKLRNAGIEVIVGVMEKECKELNEIFIKNQNEKMPFVTIKTAVTMDGKIALANGESKWITDEYSRKEVQKLRNKYDAILTGSRTVIKDNPSMTCRMRNGRNPIRIVADTNLRTLKESNIYNDDGTGVIILVGENTEEEKIKKFAKNVKIIKVPLKNGHVDLLNGLKQLYDKEGINSILVEAGGKLNKSLMEENLADRLIMFMAPKIMGDSSAISFVEGFKREKVSDCNKLELTSTKVLKKDILLNYRFTK